MGLILTNRRVVW